MRPGRQPFREAEQSRMLTGILQPPDVLFENLVGAARLAHFCDVQDRRHQLLLRLLSHAGIGRPAADSPPNLAAVSRSSCVSSLRSPRLISASAGVSAGVLMPSWA